MIINVLSYPRSGNTLLRYLLEYYTHIPSYGLEEPNGDRLVAQKRPGFEYDSVDKIYKKHDEANKSDYLIYIHRDKKEAIRRHRASYDYNNASTEREELERWNRSMDAYMDYRGEKVRIEYNNLVKSTSLALYQIDFFPTDVDFWELPTLKNECLNIYTGTHMAESFMYDIRH